MLNKRDTMKTMADHVKRTVVRREIVVTINRVFIDGYLNITNTSLNLVQPITLLIAPNNFGKTNILLAIEEVSDFIGMGPSKQEKFIEGNGYTSYNVDSSKLFSFEIEFTHENTVFTYSFAISPSEGVKAETLTVGHLTIINRSDQLAVIASNFLPISKYNLVVSNAFLPNEEATDYAKIVRTVFESLSTIICSIDTSSSLDDYIEEAVYLRDNENDQFKVFKDKFLALFPHIVDFRIVDVYFGTDKDLNTPPDDYRIEFDSVNKRRPELFQNLSAGTRRIFLLLLEVFVKRNNPLIAVEEIENGIHPTLYTNVLQTIADTCENTKIIATTHSPSVVRHFGSTYFSAFYIGIPESSGFATFAALRASTKKEVERRASMASCSIGELIFDMLSSGDKVIETLRGWLDV